MTPHDMVVTPMGLRFAGRRFACTVGRNGITHKKAEGDGATPRGVHRLVGMLYRPDRMARPADWALPIRPGDVWSDDPKAEDYNHIAQAPYPHSHERLRRSDPLYDLVILTDWNWPYAVPGRGSAIFIHRWRRPGVPTEGCIGLAREHLAWIAPRIKFATNLIVT
ncbi:MAG: L,D-transpeptidase family protein [Pseudomonadota bacterium]